MSYGLIKEKAKGRFNENLTYLNYLVSLEGSDATAPTSMEVKIMRGLFYVHLYSSFESTINELIEGTLGKISTTTVKNKHVALPFNTIALLAELKSLKDSGRKNFFNCAINLFEKIESEDPAIINVTAFSLTLQNVWSKTINEVIMCFGITSFVIDPKLRASIDELVEKRNAVAHGRESASEVGERFRTPELRKRLNDISEFTYRLIDVYEQYYQELSFVQPIYKDEYADLITK